MTTIYGSDHSRYDWMTGYGEYSPIAWTQSQAAYTFLKACDGMSDTPRYADEIVAARKAGKLAAPYVWLYQDIIQNVQRQADFWYSRLKNEPLIVIDFEGYSNSYPNASDLYDAIERLRANGYTGKIMIYTGHYYWLAHGSTANYWLQFPIWLARYSTFPPQPTPPWVGYDIWQFSASGRPENYGITNGKLAVDENRFEGTPEELAALFGAAIPPEPPIGDSMYQGTVITQSLNVRNAPVAGAVIGSLVLNDKVEADRVENGWWHLTKIRGVSTIGENWAYEGATKGYIRLDAIIVPVNETATVTVEHNGKTGTAVIELK